MTTTRLTSASLLVGVAVMLGSFGLYLSTLAPTLSWGLDRFAVDGGELLAAADTFGVPHPPGYPTYTLLLKAFATVVPVGDLAYRGNLFSALLAAFSATLVYWAALSFCRYVRPQGPSYLWPVSAAVAGSIFATTPLLWSQATITEVYALNAFFVGLLLVLATRLALPRPSGRSLSGHSVTRGLALFALILGLGLGNHLTLLAVAFPLLLWLWFRLGWRSFASPMVPAALIVGLGIYLYLPLRAGQGPPINWGNADTLGGFTWMLTGRAYQDYVFGVPVDSLVDRFISWLDLAFSQFNPLGIFLGLMGLATLWSRERAFLAASILWMLGLTVYSVTYFTVDSEVLLIPALLVFSLLAGVGFLTIVSSLRDWARTALGEEGLPTVAGHRAGPGHLVLAISIIGFGALPLTSILLNYGSQDLSDDRAAYDYAKGALDAVPDGSVVMSFEEDNVFSLWYMRYVEETHRDVAPVAVPLLQFDWYWSDLRRRFPDRFPDEAPTDNLREAIVHIIEHNGESRVYFTYRDASVSEKYGLEPLGSLYKLGVGDGP